ACDREMEIFVELMRDPVAGNMVRSLFLNRQKAAKLGLIGPQSPLEQGDDAFMPRLRQASQQAKAAGANEQQHLLALALAALTAWRDGKAEQPELADVAAVTAGIAPAYSGG